MAQILKPAIQTYCMILLAPDGATIAASSENIVLTKEQIQGQKQFQLPCPLAPQKH